MAKKRTPPVKSFSFGGWDTKQYKTTESYVAAIDKLFNDAVAEFAQIAARQSIDPNQPFYFSDYPQTQAAAQKIVNELAAKMEVVVQKGSRQAWLYACQKNDEFIKSILNTSKLSRAKLNKYNDRNLKALEAFQRRKVNGLDLSGRVWNITDQFNTTMELAIDAAIGEGKSAAQLSRDFRQYLQDPDKLFRRVRDKRGVLRLSKAAAAYHPGRGKYRSAYKNAMRVSRTEINMSYRQSDLLRWQNMDFVVGFEVKRSNKEYKCKVCDQLKGRYPKGFIFRGWHPQCRCFVVPILSDEDEFNKQELAELKAALNGGEAKKYMSRQAVTDVPQGFKDWVEENLEASKEWKSPPFFVKDNFEGGVLDGELRIVKPTIKAPSEPEAPAPVIKPEEKAISANMPKDLVPGGDYVKDSGIEFKKEFFDLIDPSKPISFELSKKIKGAFYQPFNRKVNIEDGKRLSNSVWYREKVIYHEYGHAIDWQRDMRTSQAVKGLMTSQRKAMKAPITKVVRLKQYDFKAGKYNYIKKKVNTTSIGYADFRLKNLYQRIKKMNPETFLKYGITKNDVIEQISSTLDTIMSLDVNYGGGHSKAYFKRAGMKEAEFIAHAFENTFATNSVFKKVLPELYDEMIQFIKSLS